MTTRKRNSPTKQQSNNPNASKQQMVSVSHLITQGPLPNPEILDRYEQILTGAADRIMAMAEDEAKHRHEMEKRSLEADINGMNADILDTKRGQWFGLIIGLTAIISGSIVSIYGSPWAGGFIGASGVAGLVTAFIKGRSQNENGKKN